MLSQETYEKIDREIQKFPPDKKRSAIVAALTLAQEETQWLSPEVRQEIANYLGVTPLQIDEVARFYSMFNLRPVGKFKLTVCTGLSCGLSPTESATDYLRKKLNLRFGQTTKDGLFTLVKGQCMGACGQGPNIRVNDKKLYGQMTNEKIDQLLEDLQK